MFVEALCRFCGQRARFQNPDATIEGYPHRLNGADELEPMACDLEVEVAVPDAARVPESPFMPTPVKRIRVVCRENVKEVFPHHYDDDDAHSGRPADATR